MRAAPRDTRAVEGPGIKAIRLLIEVFCLTALRRTLIDCRRHWYGLLVRLQCRSSVGPITVNFRSTVTARTELGSNVHFNGMRIQGGGRVIIGNNFHSGSECLIISGIHNYDAGNALPYDTCSYVCKDVLIEDNVWLGSRVIVLGGVSLGEGSIIQAGSVVAKSIPKGAIAGGHPAVVFKYRNMDHYESLKRLGRVH